MLPGQGWRWWIRGSAFCWLWALWCLSSDSYISIVRIRCSKCNGALGWVTSWPPGGPLSISRKSRFCPFCGVSFDSEHEENMDAGSNVGCG